MILLAGPKVGESWLIHGCEQDQMHSSKLSLRPEQRAFYCLLQTILLLSFFLCVLFVAHLHMLQVARYSAQPLHGSGRPSTAVKLPWFCIKLEARVSYCSWSSSLLRMSKKKKSDELRSLRDILLIIWVYSQTDTIFSREI